MPDGQPNERLANLLEESRLTRKALARAVQAVSIEHRAAIACDHTSVSRWLRGMHARGKTPQFIAEALGRALGRRLTTVDIGMAADADELAHLGLDYAVSVEAVGDPLPRLWRADLDDADTLTQSAVQTSAWSASALGWLVSRKRTIGYSEGVGGRRVGPSDVEAVRVTTAMFSELDNRFGGEHARRALVQYLSTDVAGLLAGRYSDAIGRELYRAVAEATLLTAWSSYDSCRHGLAQRYFIQALRLAEAADDAMLAGSILDAMSHQATFLGYFGEAVNLARAAQSGTAGRTTATLNAHFHAMEARAHAAAGDSVGAERSLGEAVRVFEGRQPGDDPEWITYFDDQELSAEFAHCFRDTGRADETVTYAHRALAGASARSDFFVTMVLADGQLAAGDLDEACETVRAALPTAEHLKSKRCVRYVRDFRRRLLPHARHAAVTELAEHADEHPLWTAAAP